MHDARGARHMHDARGARHTAVGRTASNTRAAGATLALFARCVHLPSSPLLPVARRSPLQRLVLAFVLGRPGLGPDVCLATREARGSTQAQAGIRIRPG
eukprot:364989-Chlamydomonas_euryale.AAC.4